MKRVKVVLWCVASKRSTPGRTWLLSHPTMTESSFKISLLSYRTECVAFLTPKSQLLITTSSSFIVTHLPLWLRYRCLLPSTVYWTVILASQRLSRSPWQPLPGKVFKPQTTRRLMSHMTIYVSWFCCNGWVLTLGVYITAMTRLVFCDVETGT